MKTSLLLCAFSGRFRTMLGSLSSSLSRCRLVPVNLGLALAVAGCLLAQAGWAFTCNYSITVPAGSFQMIANQCDNPSGNTLNNVFPGVPSGCQIIKFNKVSQTFDPVSTSNGTTWNLNYTLDPGEGAFFHNPNATPVTLNVSGNPHTPVPLVLPASGCCIVSRQTPFVGGFIDIVGSPPQAGDLVFRFNPVTQSYLVYIFDEFDLAWMPDAPMANVGESIWICRGGATPAPCVPDLTMPSVQCVPVTGLGCNDVYQLLASDNCPCTLQIFIRDSCSGPCGNSVVFQAGPFSPGAKVKLKKNPSPCSGGPATSGSFSGCGAVGQVKTRGNPVLVVTDCSGNTTCQICPLP
jgi:hypothetical protein